MPRIMHNPLYAGFEAQCTHPGCTGRRVFDESCSAGLIMGSIIPESFGVIATCHLCKRSQMAVVKTPPPPTPPKPKGFSNIPTK